MEPGVPKSEDFIQFQDALFFAKEQLDWGTDPSLVARAAASLRNMAPENALVCLLERKAERLTRIRESLKGQRSGPVWPTKVARTQGR